MRVRITATIAACLLVVACGGGSTKAAVTDPSTSTTAPGPTTSEFAGVVTEWRTKIEAAEVAWNRCLREGCVAYGDEYAALFAVVAPTVGLGKALGEVGVPPHETATLVTRTVERGSTTNDHWAALGKCQDRVRLQGGPTADVESKCVAELTELFQDADDIASILEAWRPYTK
jgi:hypothetical protein